MTRDTRSSPSEIFVSRLRREHPTLEVSCDVPEAPTGSTWIDIRVGDDWIIVEHHPNLGFGLTDPHDEDGMSYGTPSSRFVNTADEAIAEVERMLQALATAATTAQHDA